MTNQQSYEGKCKWFSDKHGYGFISVISEGDRKGEEMFVHVSKLSPDNQNQFKTLKTGEYCSFTVGKVNDDTDRYQATNVHGISGGPLICEANPAMRLAKSRPVPDSVMGNEQGQKTWKSVLTTKSDKSEEKNKEEKDKEEKQEPLPVPTSWGIVKWFDNKRGYGFITYKGGDDSNLVDTNVFVHFTAIQPKYNSYKTLIGGEYVSFNTHKNEKGIQAVNVQGYKGGSLFCDTNILPFSVTSDNKSEEQQDNQNYITLPTDKFIKLISGLK